MADDNANDAQAHDRQPQPNPALKSLDVMVGAWELKGRESGPDGEIHGRPTFEWMEGGFYLVQHVDIDYIGRRIVGTEYIGYDEENDNLRSYFFSNEGPGPFGAGGPRVRVGGRRGDLHDLGWGGGLSGELQGQVQRRPQHDLRALGMAGRRVRGNHDQGQLTEED